MRLYKNTDRVGMYLRTGVLWVSVRRVVPEVFTRKGLFDGGCYGSRCNDDCCIYGCDVDLATLKLIERYRRLIEPLIKAKIEDCFSTKLKRDSDYIGGA